MGKLDEKKRLIKFSNFEEMMAEVNRLNNVGYKKHGNWSLGQATDHIANWMTYPLDGFPVPPIFLRPIFWIMKVTMAKGMKRKIFAEGFSSGMPTAPESVAEADEVSDVEGINKLQEAVDRLSSFGGELKPSPLFGPMDKKALTTVTLLHAEHHLGFLQPRS